MVVPKMQEWLFEYCLIPYIVRQYRGTCSEEKWFVFLQNHFVLTGFPVNVLPVEADAENTEVSKSGHK
jgi:hypothetical protein